MTKVRSRLRVGFLAVAMLLCGRATAQDSAERAHALALYEEAARLYQSGEFGAAAELLSQAYEEYRHPTLLYNLARATEGLGDLSRAIESYEAYIAAAPDALDVPMVRARVNTLRRTMGERDALLVARARALRERNQLAAQIDQETPLSRTAWPWIVAGSGLAVAGAGSVMLLLALDAEDDAMVEPAQREAFRLHSRAETLAAWGTAALVGGGVLALTGLAWWLYGQLFEPHVEGFRSFTISAGSTTLAAELHF